MNQISVKFEADVQRQHTRYRLPLKCVIDDNTFDVLDWSVAGVGVATGNQALRTNQITDLKLLFPFDGFEFGLDVKARVCYSDPSKGRTGLQYIEVTDAQRRMFRYILDAYLSGEILKAGELLDFTKRDVVAKPRGGAARDVPRSTAAKVGSAVSTGLRYGLVAAISLGVLAFAGTSLFQRFAVFSANSAFVSTDLTTLYSTTDGVLINLASGTVESGAPVATIMRPDGENVALSSPCDCTVQDVSAKLDAPIKVGDPLFALRQSAASAFVVAMVDRQRVMDLYKGAKADVEFVDGTVLHDAPIAAFPTLTDESTTSGGPVPVRIELGERGANAGVGQPVTVRFTRNSVLNVANIPNAIMGMFGAEPARAGN